MKKKPTKRKAESLGEYRSRVSKAAYQNRVEKVAPYFSFGFNAKKLAREGKLTPSQKGTITRAVNSTRGLRAQVGRNRAVFVPVSSESRRRASKESGEVIRTTTKGVFVSVSPGQISQTGLGKTKVSVGAGGKVTIRYGKRRIETVGANKTRLARNPGKEIRRQFEESGARSVSLVINGYEAGGPSVSKKTNKALQEFEKYVNDLIARIESEIKSRNRRLRKEGEPPVDYTARGIIAFRFYYGKDVQKTYSAAEFMKSRGFKKPDAESMKGDFLANDSDFED